MQGQPYGRRPVSQWDPRIWDGDYVIVTRPGGDPTCPCMSCQQYIPHSTVRGIVRRALWALARDLRALDRNPS